ncbi:unnamed protein product [Blepharisma stoltei]|uniref:Uncharacterized protein n=1 Tax=Blepharisma stoltei TaxID=1481888 RepID=A0AAU9IZ60_9CILI|nr:unnamed protein product [Blepharisma stoltei]
MQSIRRKWQNFRTYRRLQELWNEYKALASIDTKIKDLAPLSNFLDSFQNAVKEFYNSSDRRAQIEQIFGDCTELLDLLFQHLKHYLEEEGLQPNEQNLGIFLNKLLEALELLVRSEHYRKYVERSPEMINNIITLFERVDDEQARVLALRLVNSFSIEGKKEVCKNGGLQKIMQLLLDKNEKLTREVIKTIKQFLDAKPIEIVENNEGIRVKIKKVIGGVTKLAWSLFPNDDSQRSVNQSMEEEDEPTIFPPSESMIRAATNNYIERFQAIEEAERCLSAGNSPVKEESKNEIIDEFSQVQGAVTTIVTALHQAAVEVQLDLMETLSILLEHNVKNQKEFRKVEGYDLICDCFNKIKTETTSSIEFLGGCFKILKTIVMDGRKSDHIGNLKAFELLGKLSATSPNIWIVKGAISTLRHIIEVNWKNVLCFYEKENLENLEIALQRIVLRTENPIGFYKDGELQDILAEERLDLLKSFDDLTRNLSFIMGNAWEKNVAMIKIYGSCIKNNAREIEKEYLAILSETLSSMISDLNARCSNRTLLAKNAFLSSFDGMRIAAIASLEVLNVSEECALPILCHLIQFELLYTELILSSPMAIDSKLTLFTADQVREFSKLRGFGPTGEWIFERSLLTKVGIENISDVLVSLVKAGEVEFATKILILDDYANIDKFRGFAAREEFLSSGGFELIIEHITEEPYQNLLFASTKNSGELKLRINNLISHKELANTLPLTSLSLHLLLDLSIESGYLEHSGYISQLLSTLPTYQSDLILSAVHPKYLFDPHTNSRHGSTAPSSSIAQPFTPTISCCNAFEMSHSNLKLLNTPQIVGLLIYLLKSAHDIQVEGIKCLHALSRFYLNKKILYLLQVPKILLKTLELFSQPAAEHCLKLLESTLTYSVSKEEAGLLLQIIKNENHPYQKQVQGILSKCLQLELASSFYYLDNTRLDSPELVSFPKNGYSLSFWIKIKRSSSDQIPIFSWVDHNKGLVLFQLSYKNCHNSDKKLLPFDLIKNSSLIQSQIIVNAPIQTFLQSADSSCQFDFEFTDRWQHFVLVHGKQGVTIYINGKQYALFKCSYFAGLKEKYAITGIFGDKEMISMVSKINCLEGCLDPAVISSMYSEGLLGETNFSETKSVFKLPEEEKKQELSNLIEIAHELPEETPEGTIKVGNIWLTHKGVLNQIENSNFYQATTIKQSLYEIQALPEFIAIMKTELQPRAIEYICELITKSPNNYQNFLDIGGWNSVMTLVANYKEYASADSIECLISAISNVPQAHISLRKMIVMKIETIPVIPQNRIGGLCALLNLICVLPPNLISGVIEEISNLMCHEENAKIFLSSEVNGFQVLIDLIKKQTEKEYHCLEYHSLSLFEHLVISMGQEHLDNLLDLFTFQELKTHLACMENSAVSMLSIISLHIFIGNQALLEKFLNADGGVLLFGILSSPSEAIRCAAIKFIGLLLHMSVKLFRSWFFKVRGFDMINSVLQKQKNNKYTYQMLLILAQNGFNQVGLLYPPESGILKTIINLSSIAAKAIPNQGPEPVKRIVFPEALEVLIDLLKQETNEELISDVFRSIEIILDPENCEKLLEVPFLTWCAKLVKSDEQQPIGFYQRPRDDKHLFQIYKVVTRLCYFDMNRAPKAIKFIHWLNKTIDADEYRARLVESIISCIESSPNMDTPGLVNNQTNFLKNLMAFLQNNDVLMTRVDLSSRVMHLINLLASENTSAFRAQMKNTAYFEFRDDLMIQFFKEDLPKEEYIEILRHFSFEGLASQPKFRESSTIFYFIKLLIEFQSSPDIQIEILNIFKKDICVHDENKKFLRKSMDNKNFLEFILGSRLDENINAIAHCFRSNLSSKLEQEEEDDTLSENATQEEFLAWLNSSEKRLKQMSAQIAKFIAPIDQDYKKQRAKILDMKTAKRKKAFDAMIKEKTTVQRCVQDLELKLMTLGERCKLRFQNHRNDYSQRLSVSARKSL